jgi:hypothetical protein
VVRSGGDGLTVGRQVDQGAATSVFAATSPLLTGIGGVYLRDNEVSPLDDSPPKPLAFGTEPIPVAESYRTPSTRTRPSASGTSASNCSGYDPHGRRPSTARAWPPRTN